MSKYVDIKVTIWQRLHFKEDADLQKIIDTIQTVGQNYICDDSFGFTECETLLETEDMMTVEENEDNPTVEVYDEDELIWDNSPKVS